VKNSKWVGDLAAVRFEALAGWKKQIPEIWLVLNQLMDRILSQFTYEGKPSRPRDETWFNQGKGFGYGTVHHAVGTLRMPARPRRDAPLSAVAVVDENLQVVGHQNLYVCDMSVLPYSSAANPVLTLAALALRLSQHIRRP
jgi:choline dehydrogenase-like flavoprotein